MRITRRKLLLGSVSVVAVVATSTNPVAAALTPKIDIIETAAFGTFKDVARRSLERFLKEIAVNGTTLEEFGVPGLQTWFDAMKEDDAMNSLVLRHLELVHERLRSYEHPVMRKDDLNPTAQWEYTIGLPWLPSEGGNDTFFDAALALLPPDLRTGS